VKYNININQLALASTSLDIIDAAILDYLISICSSVSDKIEKQRVRDDKGSWTWVDYSTLVEALPLLKLNNNTSVSNRIRKIFEEGFIDYMRVDHQKVYIKLTKRVDELNFITNELVNKDLGASEQAINLGLQSYQSRLTYNNINIHSQPAKKRIENIGNMIPLIDQELTPEQIYQVSLLKNVLCPTVIKKYYAIRDIIEGGDFKPKWGKDLYRILCNWIKMDIDRGKIETMDDMQTELNKWNDPKTTQGKNLFERAKKARLEHKI